MHGQDILPKILRPLVGQSRSNVLNSYSFVDEITNITVFESDILVSYDVVSLYTKVPVNESLTYIRAKLETDDTLSDRTYLTVDEIVKACALCLGSTYFTFQNTFLHQTEGLPMGSPLSPIVANKVESFSQLENGCRQCRGE